MRLDEIRTSLMKGPSDLPHSGWSVSKRLGSRINRIYNGLLRLDIVPSSHLPASVRSGLRTAFVGLLVHDPGHLPEVRGDLDRYSSLFEGASSTFRQLVGTYGPEIDWPLGRMFNGMFDCVDAFLYYSMLRAYRPQTVVEVGTGNSAQCAMDAMRVNGRGRLLTIDPDPWTRPPRGATWLRSRVQDVDRSLFEELRPGDVLFIDSSHRIEEVQYHIHRILPLLAEGVLVHVHDFHFPFDSEYGWDSHRFEETDAWLGLLSTPGSAYRVMTCAPFVRYEHPETLTVLVPPYARAPSRVPWSLWVRKMRA